ncbi:MAG: hypothetical protein AABY77_02575, partial [Nitrospirota bacterium]
MTRRSFAWRVALTVFVLGGACLPDAARAADPVKDLVKKVEARYQKTTDLTAEFAQTTSVRGFASAIKSAGRV